MPQYSPRPKIRGLPLEDGGRKTTCVYTIELRAQHEWGSVEKSDLEEIVQAW
jgi:hypothetical protein